MTLMQAIARFDRSKRTRFISIAILLSPLAVTAKWFGVVHGFFAYDDFDLLLVTRELPFAQSLFVLHGDGTIPLFRVFFAVMYRSFGVNEAFWNIYIILLLLAVNLAALAIMVELGVGFVSAAFFYAVMLTASAWQLMSFGYYSLSMYHQIGLCGLLAALALLHWLRSRRERFKWLTVIPCAVAPFIHVSGLYVPVSIFGIALLSGHAAGKQPFGAFIRGLRWLVLWQALILAVFAMYFVTALAWHGGSIFGMARADPSIGSVATSFYLFVSQGLALELFHSLVGSAMPHAYMHAGVLATTAFFGAATYFVAGLTFLQKNERLICAALLLPPTIIALMVAVGRRITDINYFVGSSGKYSCIALLWFTMAAVYVADCIVRHRLSHLKRQVAVVTFGILCLVVGRHVVSTNPWIKETQLRQQQLYELVSVFAKYAQRTAPAPMRIVTLDGEYLYPHYNLLAKYNLAHYRPFFASFDSRLTLLRNAAMFDWGSEATTTVPSLRTAVDPDFIHALETDVALQALYFGAIELQTSPRSPPSTGAPLAVHQLKLSNAQSVAAEEGTLSFSTRGGAEIRLVEGVWDPEAAHVLTLRVEGENIGDRGTAKPEIEIELTFSGELKVPYAANRIRIPSDGGQLSIDLLQLYSYALNPTVRDLVLRFPHGGRYRISGLRFG